MISDEEKLIELRNEIDSIDNAIPAMQAENDSRFKSVLSIEDVHAIYADELDAFIPIVLNAADLRKKAFPEPRWSAL